VVDDSTAVIGSSSLDSRSFHFNAERNVQISDDATGQRTAATCQDELGLSVEIRPERWDQRPLAHRLGGALARCLSPLL
jgi:phosphatidylserine/phosphatidylglycerophosphate/cardiolipin synthase-like enzyme